MLVFNQKQILVLHHASVRFQLMLLFLVTKPTEISANTAHVDNIQVKLLFYFEKPIILYT